MVVEMAGSLRARWSVQLLYPLPLVACMQQSCVMAE